MISNCPVCGSQLVKIDAMHFCLNKNCPSRNIESLIHFCSKDCMDIDGMGERVCEEFFALGFIKDIPSLYNLKDYKEKIIEIDGWKEKSVTHILNSIENSKNNSLEKLLFGLGIKEVGSKMAKQLAKMFLDIDTIMSKSVEELKAINDVGEVCANSIYNYFHDENNISIINKLKEMGIQIFHLILISLIKKLC